MGLTSSGQASGLWRLQPSEGNLDRSIDSMPDLHEGARPAKNIPNNYKFERAQKRPAGVVAERGGGALARRRLLTAHRRAVLIRPSLPHSRNRQKSPLSSHVTRHNEKPRTNNQEPPCATSKNVRKQSMSMGPTEELGAALWVGYRAPRFVHRRLPLGDDALEAVLRGVEQGLVAAHVELLGEAHQGAHGVRPKRGGSSRATRGDRRTGGGGGRGRRARGCRRGR